MADQDKAEQRVRYFDGQLLTVSELTDEQDFHERRQERHGRLLHAPGITRGLQVVPIPSQQKVTLTPGVAMDALGQQIVLEDKKDLDLPPTTEKKTLLVISYQEKDGNTQQGTGNVLRRVQAPKIEFIQENALNSEQHVVLARVTADGQVRVDTGPRQYAGVRLPGKGESALTLRSGGDDAGRLAVLDGALQVRDPGGPGSDPKALALKVSTRVQGQEKSLLEVGNDGRVMLGPTTTVGADGFIQNGTWRVTSISGQGEELDGEGKPLKLRASFPYKGGLLILFASGSARRMRRFEELEPADPSDGGPFGMTLKLNGTEVGKCKYWVKTSSYTHHSFSTTVVVNPTSFKPGTDGTVELTLQGIDDFTKYDINDLFTVTILEQPITVHTHLPFSTGG